MSGAADEPVACARAFVEAIVWGAHSTVWELLSPRGSETVLAVAVANGLDRVAAARLRDDVAPPADREDFLRQLLIGLRRDLRSVELGQLSVEPQFTADADGTVGVDLIVPSRIPGTGPWPAGRVILSNDPERGWGVDRLEPRLVSP